MRKLVSKIKYVTPFIQRSGKGKTIRRENISVIARAGVRRRFGCNRAAQGNFFR